MAKVRGQAGRVGPEAQMKVPRNKTRGAANVYNRTLGLLERVGTAMEDGNWGAARGLSQEVDNVWQNLTRDEDMPLARSLEQLGGSLRRAFTTKKLPPQLYGRIDRARQLANAGLKGA